MKPVQPAAETQPEYDVFLSYASEDRAWCERLAERLRDEGVRVWVDFWRIQPGDHLEARLNEGLERSRKLVALFSKSYFREDKHWKLAESYSQQHEDVLAQECLLIPSSWRSARSNRRCAASSTWTSAPPTTSRDAVNVRLAHGCIAPLAVFSAKRTPMHSAHLPDVKV